MGADVDVQLANLGDLLAVLVSQQVDRLLPDDAPDHAIARGQRHTLTDEDLRVPAADGRKPQVAVVVDVGDDHADLVDVAHYEQPLGRTVKAVLGRHERERRAHHVGAQLRERARRLQPHGRRIGLIAGRAARGEQVEQQLGHGALVVRTRAGHSGAGAALIGQSIPGRVLAGRIAHTLVSGDVEPEES